MRGAFRCRPYLAPLRHSFSTLAHTAQAASSFAAPSPTPTPEIRPAAQDEDDQRLRVPLLRRVLSSPPPRFLVEAGLKNMILHRPLHLITYEHLRDDLISAYGLTQAQARDLAWQIRRLVRLIHYRNVDRSVLDDLDSWKTGFFKLQREMNAPTGIIFKKLSLDPSSEKKAGDPLDGNSEITLEALMNAWADLDQSQRWEAWPRMVSAALTSNVAFLPEFIEATYSPEWSPSYVVEDTVHILAMRTKMLKLPLPSTLLKLLLFLWNSSPPPNLLPSQLVLEKLIPSAPLEDLVVLFDAARDDIRNLRSHTLLQFASRFAQSVEHKMLALDIVVFLAKNRDWPLNAPVAASICTTLLSIPKGSNLSKDQAPPDEIFKVLLENGLQPNLLNITALMRNFCHRESLETAWAIFDHFVQNGMEPDHHVYSILLNAAKTQFDMPSIRRVVNEVQSGGMWNAFIINDFLDIMFRENAMQPETRRRQRKANDAFRPMLQVYAKSFHLEPLQKLCQFQLEDYLRWQAPVLRSKTEVLEMATALMPQAESHLMEPDTISLTLMIASYIRSLNKPETIKWSFMHFMNLLRSRDPLVVKVMERHGTLMYDIFLRGLLQFSECLTPAIQLMKTMTQLAQEERSSPGPNKLHPFPSVHTWTIMINGFKNHGNASMAMSFHKMMRLSRAAGGGETRPNTATFNALIAAFSKARNPKGAVAMLREREIAGYASDQYTMRALGYLPRYARDEAISLLGQQRKATQLAEQERIAAAGPPAEDPPMGILNDGTIQTGAKTQPRGINDDRPIGTRRPAFVRRLGLGLFPDR